MSELLDLNLVEASKSLKNKEISSLELTKAYLKSIRDTSSLGAYLEIVEDKAISMAKESDKKLIDGTARPLEGIPIGCLLYTSPSPRDRTRSRMPSSA